MKAGGTRVTTYMEGAVVRVCGFSAFIFTKQIPKLKIMFKLALHLFITQRWWLLFSSLHALRSVFFYYECKCVFLASNSLIIPFSLWCICV